MRSLDMEEVQVVSGGGYMEDVTQATTFGGAVGTAVGFIVTNTVVGATRGGLFGASAMFMYSSGYAFGTWLYDAIC